MFNRFRSRETHKLCTFILFIKLHGLIFVDRVEKSCSTQHSTAKHSTVENTLYFKKDLKIARVLSIGI